MKAQSPVFGFTLGLMDGELQPKKEMQSSKVKFIEIEFQATGLKAFYLLSSARKIAQDLKAEDMHVVFIAGKLVYKVMTGLNYNAAEQIARMYGLVFSTETTIDEKGKNLENWSKEELKYELNYKNSTAIQKLVKGISTNKYWNKDYQIV